MIFCYVINCGRPRHGFSQYCQTHKQAQRRHGSPSQSAVSVHELKPFIDRVERRKSKNANSEAWGLMVVRWGVVQDHAQAVLQRLAEGLPGPRTERVAAHHLAVVGHQVEPWRVVRTALAMYLLQDHRPSRFESDTSFDFQLVRRVRGLADSNAGVYWDHREQRSKRVYRDIPPRAVIVMARSLKAAFGAPGLMLATKDREDALKAGQERKRMAAALEGLA